MEYPKLSQILEENMFWQDRIPAILKNRTNEVYDRNYYYNVRSRTLLDALRATVTNYYGSQNRGYNTIAMLCTLITDKKVELVPAYRLISSGEAETLELNQIIERDNQNMSTNAQHIYLCHVPKGKSYLKTLLDRHQELTRIPQIEQFCIEDAQHFVRIYKGYGWMHPEDIVIFSDRFTKEFIQMIFIMLPNLLNLVEITATEEHALTEEETAYNNKIRQLRIIFEHLYSVYIETKTKVDRYDSQNLRAQLNAFAEQIKAYVDLFDFVRPALNSFTEHLANAKNENAQRYLNTELDRINSSITTYENNLSEAYKKRAHIQRELLLNKQCSPEDVKPFIETIENTNAFEILSTTKDKMSLRVTAPLQYFVDSDFVAYENNPESEYNRIYRNQDLLRSILHKIFVTREYKLLVQAVIELRINDGYNDDPLYICARSTWDDYTQFPNPHLYHHDCWGPAKTEMKRNACAGNFELVAMQMVAAVQTINVAERASFVNGLLYDLINENYMGKATFIDETGTKRTYKEMLEHETLIRKAEILHAAEETINNSTNGAYAQFIISEDDANENENEDADINDDYTDYDDDENEDDEEE